MANADKLRSVSDLAGTVLCNMAESRVAAEYYLLTNESLYAERLVDFFHEVEKSSKDLNCALTENISSAFAIVNAAPVQGISPTPEPSVHTAILIQGLAMGVVSGEVFEAEFPDLRKPGVEYAEPELFARAGLLKHVDTAAKSFIENFPDCKTINYTQSLREQELARAIKEYSAARMKSQPAADQEKAQPDDLPEIKFNHDGTIATYNNHSYPLTPDQYTGLKAIVDAAGDWVSWSGLGISVPSRAKGTLPGVLKGLIVSGPGKGYRFKNSDEMK